MINALTDQKVATLNHVFTPSAPIEDRKIFAGRKEQLRQCIEIVQQPGAHGILYGERGVGKTSVANIAAIALRELGYAVAKRSCHSDDTIETLWKKVFQELSISVHPRSIGFGQQRVIEPEVLTLDHLLNNYSTQDILNILKVVDVPFVIVLDEFDRLGSEFNKRLLTDTLKNISDEALNVTIIIVGVGDDVSEIIGEHASIARNLKQVHLPIMADDELGEIIENGLAELDMEMDPKIAQKIVRFSCGYPHYTHLLSYHASRSALSKNERVIRQTHFEDAVENSIREAHERLRQAYQKATLATKTNIYKEVLWACSIAARDENGTFQATDLVEPLSKILNRRITVNNFAYHLGKFCTEERGKILIRLGVPKRHRYKFRDSLMRGFALLNLSRAMSSQEYEQLLLFVFGGE